MTDRRAHPGQGDTTHDTDRGGPPRAGPRPPWEGVGGGGVRASDSLLGWGMILSTWVGAGERMGRVHEGAAWAGRCGRGRWGRAGSGRGCSGPGAGGG